MVEHTRRTRVARLGRLATAFALTIGVVTIGAVVTPVSPAHALAIGAISAQVSNQTADIGTPAANCITYDPPLTATSSAFVTSPAEARSGHGWRSGLGNCPSPLPALSTINQSTLGIAPSAVTNVTDGVPFLLARATHYNNDINVEGNVFSGTLQLILAGFDGPPTVSFDWQLWETNNFPLTDPTRPCPNAAWYDPNHDNPSNCQDQIKFNTQISDNVLVKNGVQYRLIIQGFDPVANNVACPANPLETTPPNQFLTNEDATTASCLYATLVQIRKVTVTKVVTVPGGGTAPAQTFNFTTTGQLVDSPWQAPGAFSLAAGQTSAAREIGSADTATITEAAPPGPKWALTGLACTETGANGQPQPLAAASYDLAGRTITLDDVPAPPLPTSPDINCTVTNTYTPTATLTLVKQVSGGAATANQWNLTATGAPVAPTSGAAITGTSGSPSVTTQTVPAGTYALTESGPGGYAQVGWSCTGGTLNGTNVTLADGGNATCTVTNRFLSGNVSVVKAITGETAGADPAATFSITVDCGSVYTNTFSVTVGSVQTTPQLPAGTQCTITETPPSGGLVDGSYAWGPAPAPQTVTVVDGQTVAVTVTNPIVRVTGGLTITKVVTGDTAGAGVDGATYAITYSCVLGTTQGVQGPAPLQANGSITLTGIPAGSVCTISESATMPTPSDSAWAWDTPVFTASGATVNPVDARTITVTIPQPPTPGAPVPTVAVTVTNHLTKTPGSFTITKQADPPTGSTVLPGSTITYTVTVTSTGSVPVHAVVITDDLSQVPPYAAFGTATATVGTVAGPTGNQLTWTIGDLPAGAEYVLTYTVVVNADAKGATLRNAVTGTGDTPPTSCAPGSPCATEHVTPKWTIAKSSVPGSGSTVAPGSSVTYTLTLTNETVAAIASGIVVVDDLSNVVNHAAFAGFSAGYQGTAVQSGASIMWSPGDVAPGATIQLSYTVTVNSDAVGVTLRNVVTGAGDTPPDHCVPGTSDPQCTTTHVTPKWTVAKSSDPASGSTVQPGSTITYTLTATNQSADASASGVVVTDDLSGVLSHAAFGSFTATAQGTPVLNGTTISWTVGDLAPSATATLSYTVVIDANAFDQTIRNVITGSGTTPPQDCASGAPAVAPCSTQHQTTPGPVVEPPTAPPTAPTPPPATVPPDKLPETGSNSNGLLLIGGLVVLAGVALLLIRRPPRRRS